MDRRRLVLADSYLAGYEWGRFKNQKESLGNRSSSKPRHNLTVSLITETYSSRVCRPTHELTVRTCRIRTMYTIVRDSTSITSGLGPRRGRGYHRKKKKRKRSSCCVFNELRVTPGHSPWSYVIRINEHWLIVIRNLTRRLTSIFFYNEPISTCSRRTLCRLD